MTISEKTIVLASASPRRSALLKQAGITFEVTPSAVIETQAEGEEPVDFVRRMALEKATDVQAKLHADGTRAPVAILAADTIVVLGKEVLGKPVDADDARQMLSALSGQVHRVITGYCILSPEGAAIVDAVTTRVCFKALSATEIKAYLARNEWQDKAGSYAVQGAAAAMVRTVEGSYTNVVGLPLCEVLEALAPCFAETAKQGVRS